MGYIFSALGRKLTIGIKGVIDKNLKFGEDILDELKNNQRISEIVLVMRHVTDIKKEGLIQLMTQLNELGERGLELTFLELPKQFFDIFMEQTRKLRSKHIRSFYLPFYCDSCNEEYPQLINTSSMLLSFQSYTKPKCPACNKQLAIDITEEEIQKISLLPVDDAYKDKRKYPRFDVSAHDIHVNITINDKSEDFELVNFSEGGVCVIGPNLIEGGVNLVLELTYKGKKYSSSGTAVWHSHQGKDLYYIGLALDGNEIYKVLYKL